MSEAGAPVLAVSGNPTPEELAAVLAVLTARASAVAPEPAPAPPSRWNDRATLLRHPLRRGPGAWRAAR